MEIIMLRHGETEDNIKKVFSRDDTRLTEKGIKQIEDIKESIEGLNYNKVYYSPLKRTVETLRKLELDGIEELRIREINFGIFTGENYPGILELYPEESKLWVEDSKNYKIPKGESLLEVYTRVVEFLEEIARGKENVLLVCHDCIIRLALCWVFDNIDYFFKFKIDNGSLNILSVDEEGFKFISKLNYN